MRDDSLTYGPKTYADWLRIVLACGDIEELRRGRKR